MLEQLIIEHCSPTLASIKTAGLFNYYFSSIGDLEKYVKEQNEQLHQKGVSLEILSITARSALIYVYRKEKLKQDLRSPGVKEFLQRCGYRCLSFDSCLNTLKQKFRENNCFPHEIGLFLGYPLGDVIGFIENAGTNSKHCGPWKVYCNEAETLKLFSIYEKCKNVYMKLFLNGRSLTQLTVAV